MTARLAYVRKFLAAAAGGAAFVVTSGTVHGTALVVAQAIIAVATAAGVGAVRNGPRPGNPAGGV